VPQLYISAANKSSGKTTVSIGICAALSDRGLSVQAFKKGPDYIDPSWLSKATGHDCHNLDFYTMRREEILGTFVQFSRNADISVVEGSKGLHDAVDVEGKQSSAALARLLDAPVVLIIDTRGLTRGIAPLLLGYQSFERDVAIAGVVLNMVGGPRHEAKLRAAVEYYTDIPVLGAIGRDPAMSLVEQHLGLVPAYEVEAADQMIRQVRDTVAAHVDLDGLVAIARQAPPPSSNPLPDPCEHPAADVRLGVATDRAFGFYYPQDLDALRAAGAELVPVDTLNDPALPAIDGLLIGGGFPERHMDALAANRSLRAELRAAVESGLPVYAECGGLMYLCRRLVWGDKRCEMVGSIDADVVMQERPQGRGYVRLRETGKGRWPAVDERGDPKQLFGHEFHHSRLANTPGTFEFAYDVLRGHGVDGRHDGILHRNLLASYAHLRDVDECHWPSRFVSFVRSCRRERFGAERGAAIRRVG
jgi:cobyrinic acid a,c-diamide synthase